MAKLREWVDGKSTILKTFESDPATDEHQILRHASALQVWGVRKWVQGGWEFGTSLRLGYGELGNIGKCACP